MDWACVKIYDFLTNRGWHWHVPDAIWWPILDRRCRAVLRKDGA